ncbi:MAG: hypothetical protein EXR21_07915 [Flavobacteriaceae bacterium]|nr:hypothetical protein [Flavobacteriaceae bacterium]
MNTQPAKATHLLKRNTTLTTSISDAKNKTTLMPKTLQTLILLTFTLAAHLGFSQVVISSIVPSSGTANQTLDVIIRGNGTNFGPSSVVSFGTGITVQNVQAQNIETIMARIEITAAASAGYHDVTVTTNGSPVVLANGFDVFAAGGQVTIQLMVMPLNSISLSDFDQNNLQNSPLLFTVTIYNDAVPKTNCRAELTLSGAKYGIIGTAIKTKNLESITASQVITFNNKEFDNYKIASGNSAFFDNAIKTGTLPSDVYTYTIKLYDKLVGGPPIGEADGTNVIVNQVTRPELIAPGTPFTSQAETQRNKNPLFQWFSQGNSFDLSVFQVLAGQKTPEEVTLNRPIFIQKDIKGTSFLYPANAELLEEGKTYAWQIKLNTSPNTTGNTQLPSEVNWYRFEAAGQAPLQVHNLKVDPEEAFLLQGKSQIFNVKAYTAANEPTPNLKVEWRVIPTDAGTIDQTGLFTASSTKTGSCAIIAKFGDIQEYATVTISNFSFEEWGMKKFVQQLFGLPDAK